MKMNKSAMAPGGESEKMVNAMMKGWRTKYGSIPDAPDIAMRDEPRLLSASCSPPRSRYAAGRQ